MTQKRKAEEETIAVDGVEEAPKRGKYDDRCQVQALIAKIDAITMEMNNLQVKVASADHLKIILMMVAEVRVLACNVQVQNDLQEELVTLKRSVDQVVSTIVNNKDCETNEGISRLNCQETERAVSAVSSDAPAEEEPFILVSNRKKRKPKKKAVPEATAGKTKLKPARRAKDSVVSIRPKEGEPLDRKSLIETLKKVVKPAESGIKINRIVDCKEGINIIFEGSNVEDFTQNKGLESAGLLVTLPEKRLARMIIYDISLDYTKEEVEQGLRSQNNLPLDSKMPSNAMPSKHGI